MLCWIQRAIVTYVHVYRDFVKGSPGKEIKKETKGVLSKES